MTGFPYNHLIASLKDTLTYKQKNPAKTSNLLGVDDINPPFNSESNDKRPISTRISFRPSTKCSARIGRFSEDDSGFANISGLDSFQETGDIVVADCVKNKIAILSPGGNQKHSFIVPFSVRDIAITKSGSLLVTVGRTSGHLLHEYTLKGRLVAQYCSAADCRPANAYGVVMTSREKVALTDIQQGRVLIMNDRKKQTHFFGSAGDSVDQFLFPYYIARSSKDNLIVSDYGNHRIKIHQMDGKLKLLFGGHGSAPGELFYPMGVCVDQMDNIYVADANNYRVQMFSKKGQYLATPIKNTFDFGADVKPVNVCFSRDQLMVSLRGTRYAEIQIFEWDPTDYCESSGSSLLCCTSNKVSDSGLYHAWS